MALSDRPPASLRYPSTPSQRRALAIFAVVSLAALIRLALPVASGLFFGMLIAFSLLRFYEQLSARLRRPGLAALLLALGSGLIMLGALGALLYFLVARGIVAANDLVTSFGPDGSGRKMLARLDEMTRAPSAFGALDLAGRVRELANGAASRLTEWAAALAGATFGALLTLFFAVMTTFVVLRHWTQIAAGAERTLPLHPLHTRVVLTEFQKVGKEVFVGTILTGVVQGILGAISYAIAGAPEAALLGGLTAVSSLIPLIGTLLVWGPVGVVLLITGHVAGGLFVLIWGAVLVGLACEYVVRPRLVGGKSHVPTLLTFISLFGGVQVFGLVGLVVGPVIASVALAILRTYDKEVCAEGAPDSRRGGMF